MTAEGYTSLVISLMKVVDATGQSLAYVSSRENSSDAHMAKVLTKTTQSASSRFCFGAAVRPHFPSKSGSCHQVPAERAAATRTPPNSIVAQVRAQPLLVA
jgi:hypothetical protein